MYRPEHEVAGLGRAHREADGRQVAELADQDDVGVLPQGRAQRRREGAGVAADLALVDHAGRPRVHDLDGILEGNDVP